MSGPKQEAQGALFYEFSIEVHVPPDHSTPKEDWGATHIDPADAPRAVREYLDTLDEAAFGAASEVQPKFTSDSDPASQWIAARKGPAFFSYFDNKIVSAKRSFSSTPTTE